MKIHNYDGRIGVMMSKTYIFITLFLITISPLINTQNIQSNVDLEEYSVEYAINFQSIGPSLVQDRLITVKNDTFYTGKTTLKITNNTLSLGISLDCVFSKLTTIGGVGEKIDNTSQTILKMPCGNISITTAYKLDEYLKNILNYTLLELFIPWIIHGLGINKTIKYLSNETYIDERVTTYRKIPVYGFQVIRGIETYGITLHTKERVPWFINSTEEIYLYAGIPYPLYINSSIHIYQSSKLGEKILIKTVSISLKLKQSNLPTFIVRRIIHLKDINIVSSGLPGSNITIKGSKNNNFIVVKNYGDNVGYVMIYYKEEETISIYGVPPKTSRTIRLKTILDRDLNIEIENPKLSLYNETEFKIPFKSLLTGRIGLIITATLVAISVAGIVLYELFIKRKTI
ncbi:MAG: hypothetical protein B6U89_00390 [Desulfurococcales archaeon ex4484_58]|nr:MAG: hypothetical protein B6U89_00390 [Desulfurococcales archaeon ex4484_58]